MIAFMILGIFFISVGIAFIMPFTNVNTMFTAAIKIFGRLSLIKLANFVMISGAFSISVGKLLAMPCAKLIMNDIPAFIKVGKFCVNISAKPFNASSALLAKFGRLFPMP